MFHLLCGEIENTTIILIWFWAFFVAVGTVVVRRSILLYDRPKILFLIIYSIIMGPIIVTLSCFPFVYTLMSFPLEKMFELSFWQREITMGTLALRATSFVLTYQLVLTIVRFVPLRRELISARVARGLNHDDVADFTTSTTVEERHLWLRNDLIMLAFFQFSFYLIVLAVMWGCVIAGVHTWLIALASWLLLLIVDDWSIIADYCYQFILLPMTAHAIKVMCINMVLLVTIAIELYLAQFGFIWIVVSLAMLVSILFVIIFFLRAQYFRGEDL